MRRTWSNGRRQRFEEHLFQFVEGVERASAALCVRRLEREEWQRQYRIEELRRQEFAIKIKKEAARREQLEAQLTGWRQGNTLRQIIAQVRQCSDAEASEWSPNAVKRWLTWAERIVNRFDPFLNGYSPNVMTPPTRISTADKRFAIDLTKYLCSGRVTMLHEP
jgi:hypothetical protein